ncbi:MAG TPA: ComEC/Rec2 family competence protein [Aequorivita sp.]|nr:ComEC/Rec2 family competence protein [Aequorivita sp.]
MKYINFAIVRFSICLAGGILAAHFFSVSYFTLNLYIATLLGVLILWIIAKRHLIQYIYFGIAVYISFFVLGYLIYQLRTPEFQPTHYLHFASKDSDDLIKIKIIQSIKPDNFNSKYFAEVQSVNDKASRGTILLNVRKDSLERKYASDNILLVSTRIHNTPKPLNPHEFDYGNYLKTLDIHGQIRLSDTYVIATQTGNQTLFGFAQNLRSKAVSKLQLTKLSTDERAIIQALVLGEKRDISKELYDEYAAAGAVHILAVSGLHVSIIYFIISFLLKPLKRWKYGALLSFILVTVLLWAFALLTGLSPSVSRAVTMFSFFAFANIVNRRTNSINTLFLSFFTLLIYNPLLLFQVGFQLSYLAVLFILWLHPLISKFTYSSNKFIRNIKEIIGVSASAQLGVLPLSLYYFNLFPGLFLLTNIVILPVLSIFMIGGIIIVVLAFFEILPDWIVISYNLIIEWLNSFIRWVSLQDQFIFKDIHYSTLKTIATYLLIIAIIIHLRKREFRRLLFVLTTIIVLLVAFIYDDYRTSKNELIVFNRSRHTLIGHKNGKKLAVYKWDSSQFLANSYPVKSYKTKTAINAKMYSENKLPNLFRYNSSYVLVLDSLGVYPRMKKIETLLLTSSPKVNLNRLIDSLQPKQIVADGSNYPSYVKRWKQSCESKKLPFHYTMEKGAFFIE